MYIGTLQPHFRDLLKVMGPSDKQLLEEHVKTYYISCEITNVTVGGGGDYTLLLRKINFVIWKLK